jgi:hypothetical protein
MEHPIDYVAGLCLTFEQANLDFARHFARSFEKIGDADTAKLLEKIYRDEIGHVAYGLKWFRRWKNPGEDDWRAFCRTLKFPLSPQRAKGFMLNVEGRRAAGFDSHFIAELDVYSQSKGRTPNVFVFNPFAEGRIAKGKAFNPTRHQTQLARDLEHLPQFLCRQDDIVLVSERPSVEFLSGIKQAGFALPEFVELKHRGELANRKLGRLRPWAWSPDSAELLKPFFPNVTAEQCTSERRFNENIAQLYSKAGSADWLRKFLEKFPAGPWLCSKDDIGVAVDSLDDALEAITAIRRRGHHRIVIKQAIGLAGSNAIRLFEPEILEAQRRWMINSLAGGHQLVVEPWQERLKDFSAQLEMTSSGLKLCGYTILLNDAKGQYQGNIAEPHHHTRIPATVVKCFPNIPNASRLFLQLFAELFDHLEADLRTMDFVGPLGIDAFVYRDAHAQPRLKPMVEINPRYTMGRVTVELMRQVSQGSCGRLQLVNLSTLRAAGVEKFSDYARSLIKRFPLQLEGAPNSRIREGALCLNDPARAQVCLAVFQASRTQDTFKANILGTDSAP